MGAPKNIINCYIPKLIVGRCDSMESKIATGVDIRKVRGKAGRTGLTNGLQNGLSGKAMGNANRSEKKHGKILVEPRGLGRERSPILPKARGLGRAECPTIHLSNSKGCLSPLKDKKTMKVVFNS